MVGRHLILIKHAAPVVTPGVLAARWTLGPAGRTRCAALAQRLAGYNIAAIAASDEPKAREKAELLAAGLAFPAPPHLDHDLREHERCAADFYPAQGSFERAVRALFAQPDELVFGRETANTARTRFSTAVQRHLTATPSGDLAVRRRTQRHRAVRLLAKPGFALLRGPRTPQLMPDRDGDRQRFRGR